MARTTPRRRIPIGPIAAVAAGALVVGFAVVAPGFDAQQTPLDSGTVWAIQNGDGLRYARVNAELRELDTVKLAENPSAVVQSTENLLLFTDGNSKVATIDQSRPADIDDSSESLEDTPSGTQFVVSSGDYIGYLTDSGRVYGATVADGASAVQIEPFTEEEIADGARYVSSAVAVDDAGILYSYSAEAGAVLRYDIASGSIVGEDAVDSPPDAAGTTISAVGGTWVLLSGDELWVRGAAPRGLDVTGTAVLQVATSTGSQVLVAHEGGLIGVDVASGATTTLLGDSGLGQPAAPLVVAGETYAAWLPDGPGPGTLWSLSGGQTTLDYGGLELGEERAAQFQSNGARAILNETSTGWVWTLPSGELVPSSQDWALGSEDEGQKETTEEVPPRLLDPKPPVAVADSFGVRSGAIVALPVLLNDSDPNEDVLTIIPESVVGLDPAFGTVSVTNDNQQLSVRMQPGATGSASFSYQVTDGTTANGLNSESASVTLSVVPPDVNSAPVWCGVAGCLAEWPSPQVVPGGTVTVDALAGWVDPEGDPIFVSSVVNESGLGAAVATDDGRIVYQHPNPNDAELSTVTLSVAVSDVWGATTVQPLAVRVTATPTLEAQSFSVIARIGEPVTVDPQPHVTGTAGALRVTAAKALSASSTSIVLNPAAATFTFDADSPGSYLVDYTVSDGVAEVTGLVRITLLGAESGQITTAPVVAFVRPKEDATIDVFSAVSNPAGRVLLLSEVSGAAHAGASLSVDVVGQSLLRVSGSTDDGQAGLLGTVSYTVSDGSGAAGTSAAGMASIYLLGSGAPAAPVALDDAVTVRVGQQINIPVLDNDVAANGGSIGLDPSSIQNVSEAGLSFAAGRIVRYLAPDVPGIYDVYYTAYTAGYPELTDSAKITITVLSQDTNSPPLPRLITGRVLSGQTVSMPVAMLGVDPDGDRVVLDRITAQPTSGSAAISPDGTALVYTSAAGFSGQIEFTYQVRDSRGETGTALARVGVLDAESDPRPITYSDYVLVRAGTESTVVIDPTLNDLDPSGGSLEVIDITPDAQPGTSEFSYLESLMGEQDGNSIEFHAGDTLGSMSYIYTVANERGDTAQGFIVLTVVRAAVPDYPVVTDTILTAATRDGFTTGVDVVAGKVVWNAGDYRDLELSLWGDVPGVSVSGWRISGALPEKTLVIPFQLTGLNYAGDEVTSYGFLTVLGEDELRLALLDPNRAQEVAEKGEVSFDLADLVEYARSATLEVDGSGVAASGRRANASCELTSGTTVTYRAGADAPWDDVCTVPVKTTGQDFYTYVAVQIRVIAEDPQPILTSGALTVSPGAQATYDLTQLTSWVGRGDTSTVEYGFSYTGSQFRVEQSGQSLIVTGTDTARTGTEERVSISITTYEGVEPAGVSLQVGLAPTTLPKGASVVQQCSQASGSSCSINVIGGSGEVNPLPGTPLVLVAVDGPSTCPGVTFAASGGSVTASWTTDAVGATCTGSFVVQDAQGRLSSGDRNGTVTLDLQGFPQSPNSVSQVGYTGDSVTLRVDPGAATAAYPALTGFVVSGGGKQVTCGPDGSCPPITGLVNGTRVDYTAVSTNSVGNSLAGVTTTAWAYRSPAAPTVVATTTYDSSITSDSTGAVSVVVSTDDAQGTARYVINGETKDFTSGTTTTVTIGLPVGAATVTAEALSKFEKPVGSGPTGVSTGTSNPITVVGLPAAGEITASSPADGQITAAVGADPRGSDRPTVIFYVAAQNGGVASCNVNSSGTLTGASGGTSSATGEFAGLNGDRTYTVSACVGNGYGAVVSGTRTQVPWGAGPGVPVGAYEVSATPEAGFDSAQYSITNVGSGNSKYGIVTPSSYTLRMVAETINWGSPPDIRAQFCRGGGAQAPCTEPVQIGPADGSRLYPVRTSGFTVGLCFVGGPNPAPAPSIEGEGFASSVYTYSDILGQPVAQPDPTIVPEGAVSVSVVTTVTWTGGVAGLAPYVADTQTTLCFPGAET